MWCQRAGSPATYRYSDAQQSAPVRDASGKGCRGRSDGYSAAAYAAFRVPNDTSRPRASCHDRGPEAVQAVDVAADPCPSVIQGSAGCPHGRVALHSTHGRNYTACASGSQTGAGSYNHPYRTRKRIYSNGDRPGVHGGVCRRKSRREASSERNGGYSSGINVHAVERSRYRPPSVTGNPPALYGVGTH